MYSEINLDRVRAYMHEHHADDYRLKTNPCIMMLPYSECGLSDQFDEGWWEESRVKTHQQLMSWMHDYIEWAIHYKAGFGSEFLDRLTIRKILAWLYVLGYTGMEHKLRVWYETEYNGISNALRFVCEEFGWTYLLQPLQTP